MPALRFVILRFLLLLLLTNLPPSLLESMHVNFHQLWLDYSGVGAEGERERQRQKERKKTECVLCVCVLQANGAVPFRKKKVWKRRKTVDLWKKKYPNTTPPKKKSHTTLVFRNIHSGYHGEFVLNVFFFFLVCSELAHLMSEYNWPLFPWKKKKRKTNQLKLYGVRGEIQNLRCSPFLS